MAESDKKPWTDLQKFETLLYMFDTLNPSPEWKKFDNIPYGRNLNTVKKMIQRERARVEKEKSGEADAKKDDSTSDTGSKKPKAGPRKAQSGIGEAKKTKKRKAPDEENDGGSAGQSPVKQSKVGA